MGKNMSNTINNFLKFYFDSDILTKEEVREELIEMGVDVEEIEKKFDNLLKKIEAKKKLLEGEIKKENFERDLEEFNKLSGSFEAEGNEFTRLAARNGEGDIENSNDEKLIDFLRKKNKSNEDEK